MHLLSVYISILCHAVTLVLGFSNKDDFRTIGPFTEPRRAVTERARSFIRFASMREPKSLDHYRCLRYGRSARVNGRLLYFRRGCARARRY